MAKILEMSDSQRQEWDKWLNERPKIIRNLALKYPPDKLYTLKPNGNRVTIVSYCEDGTMTVFISSKYNDFLIFERQVFGIKPEDLIECEYIPNDPGRVLYTAFEDIDNFVKSINERYEKKL